MTAQNGTSTSWTQEQDDFLKEQYRAISAKAIGIRIGKSRNAVIGRAHRLGLGKPYQEVFGEGRAIRQHIRAPRKNRGDKSGPELFYRRLKPVKAVKMTEAEIVPLNGVGVKMWELESSHCRWVVGEPKDLTFCGQPKQSGSSYCSCHANISVRDKK
jgi:GcrA cell cycle regulator